MMRCDALANGRCELFSNRILGPPAWPGAASYKATEPPSHETRIKRDRPLVSIMGRYRHSTDVMAPGAEAKIRAKPYFANLAVVSGLSVRSAGTKVSVAAASASARH